MLVDINNAKRLGIHFFYEKTGYVDSFVKFFFEDYRKQVTDMIVVCNGELDEDGMRFFKQYTDHVIVRDNVGLDVWAYKTALDSMGWEKLIEYDEVCFANSTIMGPVYTLKEAFDTMATEDLDFWGLTKHYIIPYDPWGNCPYGYLPEHIQSHFMVFRKSLVSSKEYQEFWDNMPMIEGYNDSVARFESYFTKCFEDKGFKWDVYVKTDDLADVTNYPLMNNAKELIRDRKCPIFKRRTFWQPYDYFLYNNLGQPAKELYDYLKDSGLYDINLIWDNLLRTCHQADFVRNMHLNYTLSSKSYDKSLVDSILKNRKIALVMHLYYKDLIQDSYIHACSIPEQADVYITTDSVEKKEAILEVFRKLPCNQLKVRVIRNRGRDVSSILVGVKDVIMDYDYVCFVHDKKTTQISPGSLGESFGYKCWTNTLYNNIYIYNILSTFENNERLGILSPPEPNHGPFYRVSGDEWSNNYENAEKLAKKLDLNVPISKDKEPIAPFGTFFWFRPKAMKKLYDKNWEYEDFPPEPNGIDGTILHAIERLYPLCVQASGYYPGIVMVDEFACIEMTNQRYYTREINSILWEKGYLDNPYFYNVLDRLRDDLGLT